MTSILKKISFFHCFTLLASTSFRKNALSHESLPTAKGISNMDSFRAKRSIVKGYAAQGWAMDVGRLKKGLPPLPSLLPLFLHSLFFLCLYNSFI